MFFNVPALPGEAGVCNHINRKQKEGPQLDDIILKMKNIRKIFPGVRALDDVNIEVKKGDIL